MTTPDQAGFVHLHTHSEYSLLDGMGRIGDLVAAAKDAGQAALAITDHGTLAGAWKFAHASKQAGIKPILGAELYLAIGSRFDPQVIQIPREGADVDGEDTAAGSKPKANEHLTVLAATPAGWLNLVKINNAAQETFKGKPLADLELIRKHRDGLIVLTGCLGGPVAGPAARGDLDTAEANLRALTETVGAENVYVEIMDHGIGLESAALRPLARLADAHGLTMVATNDAHFVHAVDAGTHEVWLAAQSKSTLDSDKRFRFNGAGYHLRTEAEMRALRPSSRRWQDAVTASAEVADRIEDWVLPETRYRMPRFELPDGFATDEEYLHHLVLTGARQRYGSPLPPEVKQRLRHEEDVINSSGFSVFFLILWEMVTWARAQGILVGPGRGSAAGSCLAYCLKITDVEPIAARLLFERFLEPGRTDMPDIDVDFEQRRIPEIHTHLRELYGADFVARLGTFAMARSKRAVKDAARVLGRPDLGNRMAGLVPVDQGKPVGLGALIDPDFAAGEQFRRFVAADDTARTILDHARTVENAVLGAGIHACGVIVSGEPLTGLVPLRKDRQGLNKTLPAREQPWVTDWDGKDTEAFGLLKLDALFLRSLDVLAETSRIIAETTGEQIDFADAPVTTDLSDPRIRKTWDLLREGRTSSIFQMEGAGMRDLLVGSGPSSLEDLSAISALYRPGPMSAGMGERYIERRNGRECVDYGIYTDDPDEQRWLARVLDTTSGLCIARGETVHSVTKGRAVPIEEIVVGELVQSVDADLRPQHGRVNRVMNNGWKDIIELALRSGDSIRLTADHRVLTQDGWKAAGSLTAHDSVAAPWHLETPAQRPATTAELHWLQVRSVTDAGASEVWDLEVDEHHNFVAQKVVVHNCIFQEQLMLLGTVVAGFDAAGRAKLRRAVGKKKADLMAEVGEAFLEGATREFRDDSGAVISPVFSRGTAERLWDMFKGAAQYMFNASHSYAYGQVTFLTAYAKANWPAQTAAAVLACTDDDDKRRRVLLDLAADGIEVAPPDVNEGRATTSVGADGRLRLGLTEIRDVGKAAELVIAERDGNGPFTSLIDLTGRLGGKAVTVRVLEALIEAGALDAFGARKGMLMAVRAETADPVDAEWGGLERSERQRARLGVRVGEHPLAAHRETLKTWRTEQGVVEETGTAMGRRARSVGSLRTSALPDRGGEVVVAGVLTRWERSATRSGVLARLDVEGSDGSWIEGVMWNDHLRAQERHGVPPLGSVVAVEGWAKRHTIEVRVTDTDGSDIDASDEGESDQVRTVEVLRLRADTVARIEVEDEERLVLPPARRIDLGAALSRARALVAVRKASRRRRTAGPPKQTRLPATGPGSSAGTAPTRVPAGAGAAAGPVRAPEPVAAPEPVHPAAARTAGEGARKVAVVDTGSSRVQVVSSRSGLLNHQEATTFRSRGQLSAKATAQARHNPGTVMRLQDVDGAHLYVVAVRLSSLAPRWHQTIFEAIDDLLWSGSRRIDRLAVPASTTLLDPAALGRPTRRPALTGTSA